MWGGDLRYPEVGLESVLPHRLYYLRRKAQPRSKKGNNHPLRDRNSGGRQVRAVPAEENPLLSNLPTCSTATA